MKNILILSLGSNIEPEIFYLNTAVKLLNEYFELSKVSSVYLTDPVDCMGKNKFFNICAEYKTEINDVFDILNIIENIEVTIGRDKFNKGLKSSREIDIDILFFNKMTLNTSKLTIPHKKMFERLFVLKPLIEILSEESGYLKEYDIIKCHNNIKGQSVKLLGDVLIESK
ncbi:MAG: 2-amino-4-hydroxy-6-hydroxymethyldihydropteridine diphosphokinase [Spirochaetes bacterium]|nr:2-amino-4-hydroxy-6-hydroxymethyldihydropteridine diphosphokinase [Spirochaetota bacterium]